MLVYHHPMHVQRTHSTNAKRTQQDKKYAEALSTAAAFSRQIFAPSSTPKVELPLKGRGRAQKGVVHGTELQASTLHRHFNPQNTIKAQFDASDFQVCQSIRNHLRNCL